MLSHDVWARLMEQIVRLDDDCYFVVGGPSGSTNKYHYFKWNLGVPENDQCHKYFNILNHCLGCWLSHSSFF